DQDLIAVLAWGVEKTTWTDWPSPLRRTSQFGAIKRRTSDKPGASSTGRGRSEIRSSISSFVTAPASILQASWPRILSFLKSLLILSAFCRASVALLRTFARLNNRTSETSNRIAPLLLLHPGQAGTQFSNPSKLKSLGNE